MGGNAIEDRPRTNPSRANSPNSDVIRPGMPFDREILHGEKPVEKALFDNAAEFLRPKMADVDVDVPSSAHVVV